MKAADLREKSLEDLVELEKSFAREFFNARLKNFTNQLDDTSAIRKAKRDRARVLTVLQQRRAAASATSAEATPKAEAAPKPEASKSEAKAEAKTKASKSEAKKGKAK
jgi:large subunit ribosomal protein L29